MMKIHTMTHSPRTALIFHGGWDGHHPARLAALLGADLEDAGFRVTKTDSLDILSDAGALAGFDLIVPCWTMGKLEDAQSKALEAAVKAGSGLAGVHGGMGDAFRGDITYEWMTGGHFVGHPHVGDYTVRRTPVAHEIMQEIPEAFAYHSEQYYMMIDPAVTVLAETLYNREGSLVAMPVVWVRTWGAGRVFYSSLGHDPAEFETYPEMRKIVRRGLVWAARKS